MSEIYINVNDCYLNDIFNDKDIVSIEDVINKLQDLYDDNQRIANEFEEYKKNIDDNYEPISQSRMYDVNDNLFH